MIGLFLINEPLVSAREMTLSFRGIQVSSSSSSDEVFDDEKPGRRIPPHVTVSCVIDSENGIQFNCANPPEVLFYEIKSEEGVSMAIFDSEMEFIEALFTLSGSYQVVLTTQNYAYVGVAAI